MMTLARWGNRLEVQLLAIKGAPVYGDVDDEWPALEKAHTR
jgi:hypothetical protein